MTVKSPVAVRGVVIVEGEDVDRLNVGWEETTDVDVFNGRVGVIDEVLLENDRDIRISRTKKSGCSYWSITSVAMIFSWSQQPPQPQFQQLLEVWYSQR